jgi:NAD(P)-dependent dehydrogenase (short-subunit alcohol dehydrogenase family)
MKNVLITGASRGLGRALAIELQRRGYQVIASARNINDLDGLEVFQKVSLDISKIDSVLMARERIKEVDIIINNAAISISGAIEAVEVEAAKRVFDVNFFGTMRIFQAFTPLMRAQRHGLMVNISSGTSNQAPPLQGIYAASKAAFDRMCEAYQKEVQPFGIFVMQIHSTGIATKMRKEQTIFANEHYLGITEKVKQLEQNIHGVLPGELAKVIVDNMEKRPLSSFISAQDLMTGVNAIYK